jgi:type II secretory pathway component PulJ
VTLIEMLVVVALLVLMMTIIVQIFSAATGAVSATKVYQELDDQLRELDGTMRRDFQGVTARLNPPIDPDENLGYFEYIENSWADLQGEDTDDCLRFTTQAPPNQPFTGRMYVLPQPGTTLTNAQQLLMAQTQPITITSEYAEIIYFLRNGNLYRRVLLIAPERQAALDVVAASQTFVLGQAQTFVTGMIPGGATVSWLGVNDLSAHPSARGPQTVPRLNTLGDLTNRENRAFSPRFGDDYFGANGPDGVPDDFNLNSAGVIAGDGVPDFYPTLYPSVFSQALLNAPTLINSYPGSIATSGPRAYQFFPFPYIFPGAYSRPEQKDIRAVQNLGWIHSPDPLGSTFNHAPLDIGDSLPPPDAAHNGTPQTWWGFPTWRETLSSNWTDPAWQPNAQFRQSLGLQPFNPNSPPSPTDVNLLPPLVGFPYPPLQLFTDGTAPGGGGYGSNSSFLNVYVNASGQPVQSAWEDDLIMTGVRSFDVKAYDDSVSTYVDLGNSPSNVSQIPNTLILQFGNQQLHITDQGFGELQLPQQISLVFNFLQSLGHEGLIPPRTLDVRLDPQSLAKGIFTFIGDDGTNTPVIRLRRTWDTWSTTYTEAPANGYDPNTLIPYGLEVYPPNSPPLGTGIAPSHPVYPSYPPPYPVPLRGLQVQVRVVDPRNERIKVLTIRQDFSDKIVKQQ